MASTATDLYTSVVNAGRKQAVPRSAQPDQPDKVVTVEPKSADEIAAVLTDPERYPTPVRPVGSGSSTTRAAKVASGTRMDMTRLNQVLGMTKRTVTVQAGMRLRELDDYLAEDGFELTGACSDRDRTIGGVISSPTLGVQSDPDVRQFAASVVSLTLINGRGRKVEVTQRTQDLLSLVRTSYGLLGVIYSATLKIQPRVITTTRSSKVDFDEFVRLLPEIAEQQMAMHAACYPFRDRVYLEQRLPDGGSNEAAMLPWRLKDWASTTVLPKVAEQSGKFKRLVLAEEVINCAWLFPASRFTAALQTYRKYCVRHYRDTRFRCDLPADVWFIGEDKSSLLSPCFDEPAFALNIRSTRRDGWDDFVLGFGEFATHFHGTPVFNQTPSFRPAYARRIYGERLHRFRTMRQKLDPEDRLLNQYFAEHLG